MLDRTAIEAREKKLLASYAVLSVNSRGRVYPGSEHPLRTCFQRDRDRIVHSAAFRRMEYKTQVFIPHETDHYRTRLTHTIEVAQISRTIARSLALNEDLAEAIALVHDLGHTPFGHSGEEVLNELLKDYGGFNHNRQSLRIVDKLEQRYDEHPGLNLTYEVREGIIKHETSIPLKHPDFESAERPSLEAALVDVADEITYNAHDLDDGLSSRLLDVDKVAALPFWKYMQLDKVAAKISESSSNARYALSRGVLNFMVTDLIGETKHRLTTQRIDSLEAVHAAPEKICAYSDACLIIVNDIKKFLNEELYRHPKMETMSEWADEIIRTMYTAFLGNLKMLPRRYQEMLLTEKPEIVVADYIAGMTDRYATSIYEKLEGKLPS